MNQLLVCCAEPLLISGSFTTEVFSYFLKQCCCMVSSETGCDCFLSFCNRSHALSSMLAAAVKFFDHCKKEGRLKIAEYSK